MQWTIKLEAKTGWYAFFLYFAPGALHSPHHVPKEWIAKYRGMFDGGWDPTAPSWRRRLRPARSTAPAW